MYKQAEGTPGAAAWSLQNNLRGKWRITPAVAGTAQLDAVHRVIGRPGVILVGEGAPHRVKPLLAQEKKRIARVVGTTPIYDVIIGNDEGQVPLRKLNSYLTRLPRNISANTVGELDNRAQRAGQPVAPGRPAEGSDARRRENAQRAARRPSPLTGWRFSGCATTIVRQARSCSPRPSSSSQHGRDDQERQQPCAAAPTGRPAAGRPSGATRIPTAN